MVQPTGTCWVSPIPAAIAETRGPLNSVSRERGAGEGQEISGSDGYVFIPEEVVISGDEGVTLLP